MGYYICVPATKLVVSKEEEALKKVFSESFHVYSKRVKCRRRDQQIITGLNHQKEVPPLLLKNIFGEAAASTYDQTKCVGG